MRNIIFVIATLFILSCDKNFKSSKPGVLIDQPVMEDILYDISLLKAAKSKKFKVLNDNNVNADDYIYNKYKVDSITLRQNIEYYATNSFEIAKNIEDKIALKLKSEMMKVEKKVIQDKKAGKVKDTVVKRVFKSFK